MTSRSGNELDKITMRIGYPAENMWEMTEQEIVAYESIRGLANIMPRGLLDKYGLYDHWRGTCFQNTSPCHWLVIRYLENHSDLVDGWRTQVKYYDVLNRAEVEYLGLPPKGERT